MTPTPPLARAGFPLLLNLDYTARNFPQVVLRSAMVAIREPNGTESPTAKACACNHRLSETPCRLNPVRKVLRVSATRPQTVASPNRRGAEADCNPAQHDGEHRVHELPSPLNVLTPTRNPLLGSRLLVGVVLKSVWSENRHPCCGAMPRPRGRAKAQVGATSTCAKNNRPQSLLRLASENRQQVKHDL